MDDENGDCFWLLMVLRHYNFVCLWTLMPFLFKVLVTDMWIAFCWVKKLICLIKKLVLAFTWRCFYYTDLCFSQNVSGCIKVHLEHRLVLMLLNPTHILHISPTLYLFLSWFSFLLSILRIDGGDHKCCIQ